MSQTRFAAVALVAGAFLAWPRRASPARATGGALQRQLEEKARKIETLRSDDRAIAKLRVEAQRPLAAEEQLNVTYARQHSLAAEGETLCFDHPNAGLLGRSPQLVVEHRELERRMVPKDLARRLGGGKMHAAVATQAVTPRQVLKATSQDTEIEGVEPVERTACVPQAWAFASLSSEDAE
jgi:hypothetical protein